MSPTKQTPQRQPIMAADFERYMAFEGLVQWTNAVITQAERLEAAYSQFTNDEVCSDPIARRLLCLGTGADEHLFVVAAHKLIEHRKWVTEYGLCNNVDFSEIDSFSADDVKDLRNMREHIIAYFQGRGRDRSRWWANNADASGGGTIIGGRLDWKLFADAARRLLTALLAEPVPYPQSDFSVRAAEPVIPPARL
jgi:hypothetical protein